MADAILASSGIYSIRNTVNGKVYIGSAVVISRRWKSHLLNLKKRTHVNKKLQSGVDKYGLDAFEFEVLELVTDRNKLVAREQYWIVELNAATTGYNLRKVAESNLGMAHSPEVRRMISKSLSRYLRQPDVSERMSAIRTGMKRSDETKARIGDAHRGKKVPAEHIREMRRARALHGVTAEELAKRAASMRGKHAGARNPMSKMSEEKVRALRLRWAEGSTAKDLAASFGMSVRQARDIASGRAWSSIT